MRMRQHDWCVHAHSPAGKDRDFDAPELSCRGFVVICPIQHQLEAEAADKTE